jgi:hypothetical protein
MSAEATTTERDPYAEMRALAEQYQPRRKRVMVRRPVAPQDRYAKMIALAEKHCATERAAPLPALAPGSLLDTTKANRLTGRQRAIALMAGAVLCTVASLLYLSVREAAGWTAEARATHREAALIESEGLSARIDELNQQAEALERKATVLANYGQGVGFGQTGQDGNLLVAKADAILADRQRLRHEAGKLAWRQKMLQEDLFDVQSK